MTKEQRLRDRNRRVREFFAKLEQKNPQWKYSALLEETAKHFPPIGASTVSAILNQHGIYADKVAD